MHLIANRADAELVTVVTKSSGSADAVWRDKSVDCVVIATPPATHLELTINALSAGKHVLLEKPMALSVEDAEKLKTVTQKHKDKILMVGFQYIYNDYVRYLKKEIEKGYFGRIRMLKSEFRKMSTNREICIFWDAAPHPLSVFQYLFGFGQIEKYVGEINCNSASFTVNFANKPTLSVKLYLFGNKKVRKFTLLGEKAGAILDETLDKNKLTIMRGGKKIIPPIVAGRALKSELDYFINCVQNNKAPLTDFDFGAQVTELLENIEFRLHK